MERTKMHSSTRCKNRTYLYGTANYPVSFKPVQGRERKILRKSESTFRHGTVFAPKECFYEEEDTGMESPKMYSSSRCKNRTDLCGMVNYPVPCKPVLSRERKFEEIRVYLSPWYRICTKAMLKSKGSYWYGESVNAFLQSVQILHLPVWDWKLPCLM